MDKLNVINGHSFLASFYRHTYLKNIPHGLCDYVWGLVFAFLIFPFTWTVILLNKIDESIKFDEFRGNYTFFGAIKTSNGPFHTMIILVISLFSSALLDANCSDLMKNYLNSLSFFNGILVMYGVGILGCILIASIIYLIYIIFKTISDNIPEKEKEFKPYVPKSPSMLKLLWLGIVAFKDKNCPIMVIDYTKKPKIKSE